MQGAHRLDLQHDNTWSCQALQVCTPNLQISSFVPFACQRPGHCQYLGSTLSPASECLALCAGKLTTFSKSTLKPKTQTLNLSPNLNRAKLVNQLCLVITPNGDHISFKMLTAFCRENFWR